MPLACGFERDRLIVRPSSQRAYDIIGQREQQPFTTCQANGDRCTTLMVHRFQIACDGVTVPWMHVAAAIPARKSQRQWVSSGRLTIVRPVPGATGQICSARDRRECLPWASSPPMERIELPSGFAPLSLAGARIDLGPPPAPIAETPGRATAMPQDIAPAAVVAQSPAPPATTAPAAVPPLQVATTASAKPAEWVTVLEAKDLSEAASVEASSYMAIFAWLAALGFLGGLLALAVARLPTERRAAIAEEVRARAERSWTSLSDRLASVRVTPAEIDAVADEAKGEAALANAAWAAATLLDQIEQAVQGLEHGTPLREVLEGELASIHQRLVVTRASALDGNSSAKAAGQFRALIRELERVQRIAKSAAASLSGIRPAVGMPKTKGEAYQLLGVNADVNEGILKKLVDALRMTWHPDHARDESDRLLREDRIKQINIAWDLICDKRAAA